MKLYHLVIWRFSAALVVILSAWAVFFYVAIMEEVNDEVDDSLEDYSEWLILRALNGEDMPEENNGSNNQYFLYEVTAEYARSHPSITYRDEMVYITEKYEKEPARILITIFETEDNRFMELVVYTPTIEKKDLQIAILGWIVFLYILLLFIILGINAWVYRKNLKPLYTLLEWLDNYRLGHRNAPLENKTKITEFHRLNTAAIAYAARTEQMFEQQKLFIGNASHEMQTPLAICRNRIEMLMEEENLTESQLTELNKIHGTLENLTKLNRSLLLLCKIENGQFPETREVCLNELLEKYIDDYKEVFAHKKISVEIEEKGKFYHHMNESLAATMVTNLLKNAFVHGTEHGNIRIVFTGHQLSISNNGTKALDREHLFERFYQREKKEGTTGLGLALVESICKTTGLSIDYSFVQGMHCFRIEKNRNG